MNTNVTPWYVSCRFFPGVPMTRQALCVCFVSALLALGCDDGDSPAGGSDAETDAGGMDGGGEDAAEGGECSTDGECVDSQYCAFERDTDLFGTCVDGCRLSPDNCPGKGSCDPDSRECIAECGDDTDCEDAQYCDDGGTCREGCRTDPDSCGAEEVCDELRRECFPVTSACCLEAGACEVLKASECGERGGEVHPRPVCDPNPCEQPPECDSDGDCADDEYCTGRGECAEGCRQDPNDTCDEGEACGPDHTCQPTECEGDGDCPGELYCLQPFDQCVEACAENDDCPDDFSCTDGRCTRGCVDNADAEPNDSAEEANALAFGEESSVEGDDGRLCPLDADWFRVVLPEPTRLRVELSCADGDPDLAVELHDAEGRVAGSNEEGCAETFTWPPEADETIEGEFFVRVFGAAPDLGADYALTITQVAPEGLCENDEGEPDDAPGDATPLNADENLVEGRSLCGDDPDWYSVALGEGDGVEIVLTVRGEGDLTFDFTGPGRPANDFDANDPLVLHPEAAEEGEAGEQILSAAVAPNNQLIRGGIWYLRVRGEGLEDEADYDIAVNVTRVGEACVPDASEPNDDADGATDLMAIEGFADGDVLQAEAELTVEGLTLCDGDADWYRMVLAQGDRVTALVTVLDGEGAPREATGPIEVAIVDADGNPQGPIGRFDGPEIIGRSAGLAQGGEYFVRVGGDGVAPAYELTVLRRAAAAMCIDDRFDIGGRNDTRETADPIELGDDALVVADLAICNTDAQNGDVDWFTFQVAQDGDLQVDLTFANADGDLDVEVYRDDVLLETGDSADDNEQVVVADAVPGQYYVRVFSFFGAENAYDLRVELTPRAVCDPDGLEGQDGNSGLGDAVLADEGFDEEAWICEFPEDEDWFRVEVPAGVARTFHVDFLRDDDGWITLDVYNADGELVTTSEANVNGQCVVVDSNPEASTWNFAVVARTFNRRDASPDRVDYRVRVVDGDACADLEPLLPDEWLHLP